MGTRMTDNCFTNFITKSSGERKEGTMSKLLQRSRSLFYTFGRIRIKGGGAHTLSQGILFALA
jgi:hypothetical protein